VIDPGGRSKNRVVRAFIVKRRATTRVAGDSETTCDRYACLKRLAVARYAGSLWRTMPSGQGCAGPRARGLALGYMLSPTTRATPGLKCRAIYQDSSGRNASITASPTFNYTRRDMFAGRFLVKPGTQC
jgi:hypothetical protein